MERKRKHFSNSHKSCQIWWGEKSCCYIYFLAVTVYYFFYVGSPKESIFLTTYYGLYFSHQYTNITNYISSWFFIAYQLYVRAPDTHWNYIFVFKFKTIQLRIATCKASLKLYLETRLIGSREGFELGTLRSWGARSAIWATVLRSLKLYTSYFK